MSPIRGWLLGLVLLSFSSAYAQTSAPGSAGEPPTFHANARVVLLDVVVTNGKDDPVTGLAREDFKVFEDGKPQTLASFDEHAGLPDVAALSAQAKLPPNVFSNRPLAKTGDAGNVLVLDALNTPITDQAYVHAQMMKYVRKIKPGTRLAIFTLGTHLRFVQGFTDDPAILLAALDGKKSAGNPELSPLLLTNTEADANQRLVAQMQEMSLQSGSAQLAASAEALREFLQENEQFHTDTRVHTTLEAMQQLARYLSGIPGRKNVIWFSGSFPLALFDSADGGPGSAMRVYHDELARTADLLTAAQVAVYPIGAEGLAPDRHYDFSNQQPSKVASAKVEQQMTQYQNDDLLQGSLERNAGHAAMDELAKDTGGEALYNTNGLNEAVDRVINHGTHYYTITYTPAKTEMDGRLRRLEVKLADANYHLAYRRGYYASDVRGAKAPGADAKGDPLRPLMDHGTPESTQVLYTMRVLPANPQPAPDARRAGDNENLKGPVTRYTMTFNISSDHLTLEPDDKGVRHGGVEVTLLGYDRDGKPLNWMVRMFQFAIPPERYATVQTAGIGVNLDLDMPSSGVYLRSGVYDQASSKAGTLEIPLAAVGLK